MAKRTGKKRMLSQAAAPISRRATFWERLALRATVIVGAVFWIFWPTLHGSRLWDDSLYTTQNPLLHDPARLWKTWFAPGSLIEYYPLKDTVQWLQWQLWGGETFGYHLTNVLLHTVGALLVWRLLSKLGLRDGWLGGLLFAIHPLMVESVAWISELKNTLSLPPFLLAMCFFIDYEAGGRRKDYLLSLGFFLVAMLCKTTMLMFPAVMLLYVWWRRGAVRRKDLAMCLPFGVISLALGLVTIFAGSWYEQLHQLHAQVKPVGTLLGPLDLTGIILAFYFIKFFWPSDLLPNYSHWATASPSWWYVLPWPILAGALAWFWTKRAGWGRHVLLGLGFFLLNLVPVLGFIVARHATMIWSLDHLGYIPLIGLIGLVVAGWERLREWLPAGARPTGATIGAVLLGLLAWESHAYAARFVNQVTLWNYTLERNPDDWVAHNNLGAELRKESRVAEAMDHFDRAIQLKPDYAEAHNNRGYTLSQDMEGRLPEAIHEYELSIQLNPYYALAHNNLANVLNKVGRFDDAVEQYKIALKIDPNCHQAHGNWGLYLMEHGQIPEAMEHYEQALKINPDYAEAHNNLGFCLGQQGHTVEAIAHFDRAIELNPDYVKAYNNLGVALFRLHRVPEAIARYRQALEIDPNDLFLRSHLASVLAQAGRVSDAIEQYEKILQLNPNDANARKQLALLRTIPPNASPAEFPSR